MPNKFRASRSGEHYAANSLDTSAEPVAGRNHLLGGVNPGWRLLTDLTQGVVIPSLQLFRRRAGENLSHLRLRAGERMEPTLVSEHFGEHPEAQILSIDTLDQK